MLVGEGESMTSFLVALMLPFFPSSDYDFGTIEYLILILFASVFHHSNILFPHLYLQHIGEFNYARLADFGAAISGANKLQCLAVLEELDVCRLYRLYSFMVL